MSQTPNRHTEASGDAGQPRRIRLLSTELPASVAESAETLTGPAASAHLITSLIGRKDREHFVVVHLSTKHEPMAVETVAIGHLSAALVHPREVFKSAVLANSASVVIGHNHPSGDLTPSPEDRQVWTELRDAGKILGIQVLDFLIVSGARWYSLLQEE